MISEAPAPERRHQTNVLPEAVHPAHRGAPLLRVRNLLRIRKAHARHARIPQHPISHMQLNHPAQLPNDLLRADPAQHHHRCPRAGEMTIRMMMTIGYLHQKRLVPPIPVLRIPRRPRNQPHARQPPNGIPLPGLMAHHLSPRRPPLHLVRRTPPRHLVIPRSQRRMVRKPQTPSTRSRKCRR